MMNRIAQRFLAKIDKQTGAPCWIWTGAKDSHGYGRFFADRKNAIRAHRFAWEFFNKKAIPHGMVICHSCDNTSCVNPSHLRAETQAFNNREAIERGRWNPNVGTANGRAILTPTEVQEIRKATRETQMVLAARYGIAQTQVGRIIRGECWAAVE